MAAKEQFVNVENRGRDIKHLGVKVEGERELVLGSSDDRGRKDKDGKLLLQPVQRVPSGIWETAMKLRAVRGWVESGEITFTGA